MSPGPRWSSTGGARPISVTQSSNIDSLMRLAFGYWGSRAFLLACRLGLFTLVQRGEDSPLRVAQALSLPIRGIRVLMDAMASQGLLVKEGERYENGDEASTLLVENDSGYIGDFFLAVNDMFYAPSLDLERALREDRPVWNVDDEGRHEAISPEESRLFTRSLHGLHSSVAQTLAQSYDLSRGKRLLDVGGGSGVMSMALVGANPALMATVLDRSQVCGQARELIAEAGLSGRVDTLEGDFFLEDYPGGYDVHLYSSILHNFNSDVGLALLTKSHRFLPPGGQVFIVEYVLDQDRTSPAFGALFNLFAITTMEGGEARTFEEIRRWLKAVGFGEIGIKALLGPWSLIHATKEPRSLGTAQSIR